LGTALPCAARALSVSISILFRLDRDGQAAPASESAVFACVRGVSALSCGWNLASRPSGEAHLDCQESPPARRAFGVSGFRQLALPPIGRFSLPILDSPRVCQAGRSSDAALRTASGNGAVRHDLEQQTEFHLTRRISAYSVGRIFAYSPSAAIGRQHRRTASPAPARANRSRGGRLGRGAVGHLVARQAHERLGRLRGGWAVARLHGQLAAKPHSNASPNVSLTGLPTKSPRSDR